MLAWGAINARQPNPSIPQVKFKLDYSGGKSWRTFKNTCQALRRALARLGGDRVQVQRRHVLGAASVAADAPERRLPPLACIADRVGAAPVALEGPIAELEVYPNWVYSSHFHALFGRATYGGIAIYGFKTTRYGAPLDTYGRNLYLDSFNSKYGPGWHRENSFVAHGPSGMFCYGFYPYSSYPGYPAQRTMEIAGQRQEVPHHDDRPRGHARHHVGRRRTPELRLAQCRRSWTGSSR